MEFLLPIILILASAMFASLAVLFGADSRNDFRDSRHNW